MILKTKSPGRVVNRWVRVRGRRMVKPWFRFDEKGYAELDETKITQAELIKLTSLFEVVEGPKLKEPELLKENSDKSWVDMNEEEIRMYAKEKGVRSWHLMKLDTLKEKLEELEG